MASSTLTGYYSPTASVVFDLVSSTNEGADWRVSGRSLGTPYMVSLRRVVGRTGQRSNDRITLRVSYSDQNAETALASTANVTLEVSIPRDVIAVPNSQSVEMLSVLGSILNDQSPTAVTNNIVQALVNGLNL